MSQEETLIKNFEMFQGHAKKLEGKGTLSKFLQDQAERIMCAPASTRLEFVGAYPGGLVEHSLRVLSLMARQKNALSTFGTDSLTVSSESIILTSLFHDIGKIGTSNKDYYVENDSSWHREKLGQMYNIVDKFQHLSVSQLSLMHLVENGVSLSNDEWYAITSIRDRHRSDDTPTNGEPVLAVLLQQAVKLSCVLGKGKREATLFA